MWLRHVETCAKHENHQGSSSKPGMGIKTNMNLSENRVYQVYIPKASSFSFKNHVWTTNWPHDPTWSHILGPSGLPSFCWRWFKRSCRHWSSSAHCSSFFTWADRKRRKRMVRSHANFTMLFTKNCLVVYLPLWKIWKSVGVIIPNIYIYIYIHTYIYIYIYGKIQNVPNHQPEKYFLYQWAATTPLVSILLRCWLSENDGPQRFPPFFLYGKQLPVERITEETHCLNEVYDRFKCFWFVESDFF